ncbi:unnamed protein product [Adineta steineri]|uniref:Uncharacterized protein n=1 Tax=Adineta steineri TaxID=433720 RepID=A0A815ASV9_9BILA|nr:unnamed protein product [Adineta steineri]CAF1259742.1 unnamed protein product [Adineta steineri]
METFHTERNFRQENNKYKRHKSMKHLQNNNDNDYNDDEQEQCLQNQSSINNTHSFSSSFRHSLRQLTSCASARRKPGRNSNHNKHGTSTTDTLITYKDEQRNSSKTLLPSTKSSSSSSQKQHNRSALSTIQSPSQDIPPALPPRKPMDKKNSVQMSSVILNPSVFNKSSSQISSSTVDDTSSSSMVPTRVLTSKEISTSLVNLMGTASDSLSVNNPAQTSTQESRVCIKFLFSFF